MAKDDWESVLEEAQRRAVHERWRAAGDRLRRQSPQIYAELLSMLLACALEPDEEIEEENLRSAAGWTVGRG